jgi:hypothetical protein
MEKNVKWNVVLDCEAVWKATESQDGHSRGPEPPDYKAGVVTTTPRLWYFFAADEQCGSSAATLTIIKA